MRNRYLLRAALIGALCALSGCASQGPAAIAIDPPAAHNPISMSVIRTFSPRASSGNTVKAEHYEAPPGFDNDVALHPYTSGLGPCPHGGPEKVVCSDLIPASHYNH